jgi:Family of unknown function (DUF5808)
MDGSHGREAQMSEHDVNAGRAPEPQGRLVGLPYDFRRPTASRIRSRARNPDDRRIFTPKTFGWGLGINFYWLVHPVRLMRARRDSR